MDENASDDFRKEANGSMDEPSRGPGRSYIIAVSIGVTVVVLIISVLFMIKRRQWKKTKAQLNGEVQGKRKDKRFWKGIKAPPRWLEGRSSDTSVDAAIERFWDRELRRLIASRVQEEEQRSDKGEQVWACTHAIRGRLKHWILSAYEFKYELRYRRRDGKETNGITAPSGDIGTGFRKGSGWMSLFFVRGRYDQHSEPFDRKQEERNFFLNTDFEPLIHLGKGLSCYLILIGWTRKTKEEVDSVASNVMASFHIYNIFVNNCQHYVRRIAEQIVRKHARARDWDWFYKASFRSYRWLPWIPKKPPPLPVDLAGHWLEKMKSLQKDRTLNDDRRQRLRRNMRSLNDYIEDSKSEYVDRYAANEGNWHVDYSLPLASHLNEDDVLGEEDQLETSYLWTADHDPSTGLLDTGAGQEHHHGRDHSFGDAGYQMSNSNGDHGGGRGDHIGSSGGGGGGGGGGGHG